MNYAISYNRGGSHRAFNPSEVTNDQYSAKVEHSDIALFSCTTQYKRLGPGRRRLKPNRTIPRYSSSVHLKCTHALKQRFLQRQSTTTEKLFQRALKEQRKGLEDGFLLWSCFSNSCSQGSLQYHRNSFALR